MLDRVDVFTKIMKPILLTFSSSRKYTIVHFKNLLHMFQLQRGVLFGKTIFEMRLKNIQDNSINTKLK